MPAAFFSLFLPVKLKPALFFRCVPLPAALLPLDFVLFPLELEGLLRFCAGPCGNGLGLPLAALGVFALRAPGTGGNAGTEGQMPPLL